MDKEKLEKALNEFFKVWYDDEMATIEDFEEVTEEHLDRQEKYIGSEYAFTVRYARKPYEWGYDMFKESDADYALHINTDVGFNFWQIY